MSSAMCWRIAFTAVVAVVAVRVDDEPAVADDIPPQQAPTEVPMDPTEMADKMRTSFHHRVAFAKDMVKKENDAKLEARLKGCTLCTGCLLLDKCYTTNEDNDQPYTAQMCGSVQGTWCANIGPIVAEEAEQAQEEEEEEHQQADAKPMDPTEMAEKMKKHMHYRVGLAKGMVTQHVAAKEEARLQACAKCTGCLVLDQCHVNHDGSVKYTEQQCGVVEGTWCADVMYVTEAPDELETEAPAEASVTQVPLAGEEAAQAPDAATDEAQSLQEVTVTDAPAEETTLSPIEMAAKMGTRFHHRVNLAKGLVKQEKEDKLRAGVNACVECTGCLKEDQCYTVQEGTDEKYTKDECGYISGFWCAETELVTESPDDEEERIEAQEAAEEDEQRRKMSPQEIATKMSRFHHRVNLAKGIVKQEKDAKVDANAKACGACAGCLKGDQCYYQSPDEEPYTADMCGFVHGQWCKDVVLVAEPPAEE